MKLLSTLATFFVASTAQAYSPYINRVYEYCPAPGQFINEIPEYEAGMTYNDIIDMAEEYICGTENGSMISLGNFGGYIVFGFDHPVVNRHGYYDFKINGNAIISDTQRQSGSCEPGIVSVSVDANGNGLPDDPWYELAGSNHSSEGTLTNYSVTYRHPDEMKTPVTAGAPKFITDTEYMAWEDSEGNTGWIPRLTSHSQSYWPGWLDDETEITLTGTCLAPNAIALNDQGTNYTLKMLDWGYADNEPNKSFAGFNIDHAVDTDNNPVLLSQIDFIRVHTATHQQCGWLGEASTEITGAIDLHPEYQYQPQWPDNPEDPHADNPFAGIWQPATLPSFALQNTGPNLWQLKADTNTIVEVFDVTGRRLLCKEIQPSQTLDLTPFPTGVYIITDRISVQRIARP